MPSKYLHRRIKHAARWEVAKHWLRLHSNVQVVGIAGSVGKTTTKDLTAAVLAEAGGTVQSRANFDPIFNLPQTALRVRKNTRYFVAEMGIDAPGQMAHYLTLVHPVVGVLTELSPEHTDADHLQSFETAIKEECLLIRNIPATGWAVLNGDNELIRHHAANLTPQTIFFGFGAQNDVRIEHATQTLEGTQPWLSFKLIGNIEGSFRIPLLGTHNALCATAACCVGHILGLTSQQIKTGLEKAVPPPGRLEVKQTNWGGIVIDDTYNSSPKAAMAAIDTLVSLDRDKQAVLVLADMLELGDLASAAHDEIGRYAAANGIQTILSYGDHASDICRGYGEAGVCHVYSGRDEISAWLHDHSPSLVLLKGSRGMKLNEVVAEITS